MNLQKEPSAIIGSIVAIVTAILALLVAYGFNVSQEQQAAILGVTAVVAPLVASLIIRFNVFSPATTDKIANQQYVAGLKDAAQPPVPSPPADGAKDIDAELKVN